MAGVQLLFVCFCLIMVQTSSAFFFSNARAKQSAAKPVDEECVELARRGDCGFYECFNERHPCEEPNNFAIKYGFRFCSRFSQNYDRMTAEGQRWLTGTKQCAMEKLLDLYRLDSLSCSEVDTQMRERQAACDAENGLCHGRLLIQNKAIFSDVYAFNRHAAVQFLQTVKQCTMTKFREATTWFREQLHGYEEVGQSAVPFFREVEQRMERLKEDVQGEFSMLHDTVQQIGRAFRVMNSETSNSEKTSESQTPRLQTARLQSPRKHQKSNRVD